jgi:hypothetical protein
VLSGQALGETPGRAQGLDERAQRRHHDLLCLIVGVKLIGDAISGLTGRRCSW